MRGGVEFGARARLTYTYTWPFLPRRAACCRLREHPPIPGHLASSQSPNLPSESQSCQKATGLKLGVSDSVPIRLLFPRPPSVVDIQRLSPAHEVGGPLSPGTRPADLSKPAPQTVNDSAVLHASSPSKHSSHRARLSQVPSAARAGGRNDENSGLPGPIQTSNRLPARVPTARGVARSAGPQHRKRSANSRGTAAVLARRRWCWCCAALLHDAWPSLLGCSGRRCGWLARCDRDRLLA
ncbi:hypothetical protein BU26DRAFT_508616 [Trematosphaeria pertusa]|uniref:Uncharacterized protein n=1 Tax=Trematosphaeria pertusa TaxID=390896 RepID=A0A6A6I3T7_9PLEO|nr:uncharacterized protein BU26DRAFT_508616 [Trematosphaeria pertusa]KAF2244602.1 hypothetical protein BU26DRAFT_508616 [Trematosphaeria pertusa]